MTKFTPGDRVECVHEYESIPKGAIGTVLVVEERHSNGGWIHVHWDKYHSGMHSCNGMCPTGHGYRTWGNNLRLLVREEEISDFDIGDFLPLISSELR